MTAASAATPQPRPSLHAPPVRPAAVLQSPPMEIGLGLRRRRDRGVGERAANRGHQLVCRRDAVRHDSRFDFGKKSIGRRVPQKRGQGPTPSRSPRARRRRPAVDVVDRAVGDIRSAPEAALRALVQKSVDRVPREYAPRPNLASAG